MARPTLSLDTPAAVAVGLRARRGRPLTQRTAWVRSLAAPIREFIATENVGAVVLLAATVVALLWVHSPWGRPTSGSGRPSRRCAWPVWSLPWTWATGSTTA